MCLAHHQGMQRECCSVFYADLLINLRFLRKMKRVNLNFRLDWLGGKVLLVRDFLDLSKANTIDRI